MYQYSEPFQDEDCPPLSEPQKKIDNSIGARLRKNPQKMKPIFSSDELSNTTSELQTTTSISENELNKCKYILEKIKKHDKSLYFRAPAVRCFETEKEKGYYKSVISHPQDLGQITKKLNSKKYDNIQNFYDDLTLIWNNAQKFNEKYSTVYSDSVFMRKYVEKLFKENEIFDQIIPYTKKKEISEDNNINKTYKNMNNNNSLSNKKRTRNDSSDIQEVESVSSDNSGILPIMDIKYETEIIENNVGRKNSEKNNTENKNGNFLDMIKKITGSKITNNKMGNNEDVNISCDYKNNASTQCQSINYNSFLSSNNNSNYNDNNYINYNNNQNQNLNKNNEYFNNMSNNNGYPFNNEPENKMVIECDEKSSKLRNLIAFKIDTLSDNDLFGLIEYIEAIRPEAIIEVQGREIDIDMTKFDNNTFNKVHNFVDTLYRNNLILNGLK